MATRRKAVPPSQAPLPCPPNVTKRIVGRIWMYRSQLRRAGRTIFSPWLLSPGDASTWLRDNEADESQWRDYKRPENLLAGMAAKLIAMWRDGQIAASSAEATILLGSIEDRVKRREQRQNGPR